MRNKIENKNTRKIYKKSGSYGVTIPMEMINELGIREGQKVELALKGKKIVIKDWEK